MKPYSSQKLSDSKWIFVYRLSRARRSTMLLEFYQTGFEFYLHAYLQPNNATKITLACCVLHNILRTHSKNSYSPIGFADEVEENGNKRWGKWRDRNNWQCNP